MTATADLTTSTYPAVSSPSLGTRLGWAVTDTLTIARRSRISWARVPAYIVFTMIQPIMLVLLFRYVFAGAIPVHGSGGYVNFMLPGVIGQTAGFATFTTAISFAKERKDGVIDRFLSMPMARSAALAGRLSADVGRMVVTLGIVIGVGYAVGFRFTNGAPAALAMVGVAIAFVTAICCVAAYTGLAIGDVEGVQAFGTVWVFPVTFVSSAFVPIQSMPGWLQAFAANQPFTIVINTMRALALGGPVEANLLKSIAWMAGIFLVFVPLAVRSYRAR